VLVVDDHEEFRASTRELLRAGGWDVVAEAADSTGAVAAARTLGPDLVLLDVGLAADDPGGDGIDVARTLAALPDPPVVILVSARSAASYGRRLADAPVRGFVPKAALSGQALEALLRRG